MNLLSEKAEERARFFRTYASMNPSQPPNPIGSKIAERIDPETVFPNDFPEARLLWYFATAKNKILQPSGKRKPDVVKTQFLENLKVKGSPEIARPKNYFSTKHFDSSIVIDADAYIQSMREMQIRKDKNDEKILKIMFSSLKEIPYDLVLFPENLKKLQLSNNFVIAFSLTFFSQLSFKI